MSETFTPGDKVRIGRGNREWEVVSDLRDLGFDLVTITTWSVKRITRIVSASKLSIF